MLQLTENTRPRQPQIAKKSKNELPLFGSFLAAPTAARTPAVNTSAAPPIGVLRASMLPCCQRYQRAISGIACRAWERGDRR
jgi:hypothetical protein